MKFRAAFYTGTRPGLAGIYNRLVRWWTRSPYSHCELIFSDDIAASSSYMDGGVRFKKIDFNLDNWDFIDLPVWLEQSARDWFTEHEGDDYDVLGNIYFIVSLVQDDKDAWFCSEAMSKALGIIDPWRYSPALLWSLLITLTQSSANNAG